MKKYFIKFISHLSYFPCERILISPGMKITAKCDKRGVFEVHYMHLFDIVCKQSQHHKHRSL